MHVDEDKSFYARYESMVTRLALQVDNARGLERYVKRFKVGTKVSIGSDVLHKVRVHCYKIFQGSPFTNIPFMEEIKR